MDALVRGAAALAVGFGGGLLFRALHIPLPWMLGSLVAVGIVSAFLKQNLLPTVLRTVSRPVVGVLAGASFTPGVAASLGAEWPLVIIVAIMSLAVTFLGWIFFRLWRFDNVTAFFASSPGGLAELTLIGAAAGGDIRNLVLIHATRIVLVVTIIPLIFSLFFAPPGGLVDLPSIPGATYPDAVDWGILVLCGLGGFLAGHFLRLRSGLIIPALVFSAIAHATGLTAAAPPPWLVALVQIVIGASAGGNFSVAGEHGVVRVLVPAIVWTLVLLLIAIGVAVACAYLFDRPLAAFICAFAPGGLAEMTVLAYAAGIEVALVVFCQVIRVFTIQLLAPGLFRFVQSRDGVDDRLR